MGIAVVSKQLQCSSWNQSEVNNSLQTDLMITNPA